MRVIIGTRIYKPEAAAAAFRLEALARAFLRHGHEVCVLTVAPPKASRDDADETLRSGGLTVRRWPVVRDRTGYVRGYIPYLSFDVPLFFRILFGHKADALVLEPPPTTWLLGALASRIRRIPYFLYAADVWSDASSSTGAAGIVVRAVRMMERLAIKRAAGVFAVNDVVKRRIQEICSDAPVLDIGNGVDTSVFKHVGNRPSTGVYALYSGTASEWQGADIFIRAAGVLNLPKEDFEVVFLGQGTALPELKALARKLSVNVSFVDTVPPAEAASWMRGARMSLASIRPESGYDVAFPTKIFAAWACGVPVVYAGAGPAREVLEEHPFLGYGVDYELSEVVKAMKALLGDSNEESASNIADWASENVSLDSVAERAAQFVLRQLAR